MEPIVGYSTSNISILERGVFFAVPSNPSINSLHSSLRSTLSPSLLINLNYKTIRARSPGIEGRIEVREAAPLDSMESSYRRGVDPGTMYAASQPPTNRRTCVATHRVSPSR